MTHESQEYQTGTKAYFRQSFGCDDALKYHDEEYGASNQKFDEREKVLEFMLGHFSPGETFRPLTLPSLNWRFENMALMRHEGPCHFVGVERSVSIFHKAKHRMPKQGNGIYSLAHHTHTMGSADFEYSRARARWGCKRKNGSDQNHRYLNLGLSDYFSMLSETYGASWQERKKYCFKFMRRNAAWLDFTSMFCREVDRSLALFPICLDSNPNPKPLVVTVMFGRDMAGGESARVKRVESLVHGYRHCKQWSYRGKSGTRMLTICGVVE